MNVLLSLAWADFLERTRRYGFLVLLGLVLSLGYLVNIGQITLRLETYRGVFNSAWVGSMMTLVVNFLLGWFGFYLVKGSILRDYETGVGQIMATTPLSRLTYVVGKWLSNMLVLDCLVLVLMLAAVAMQVVQREAPQVDLGALGAPFLLVALPFMALVAALAVLFETIPWLRGSGGNVVYFVFFVLGITVVGIQWGGRIPLLDWLGFGVFKDSMAAAARAAYPGYRGGLSLSLVPALGDIRTFDWSGVPWTLPLVLNRLALFVLALGLTLVSALFFDRFDGSKVRPKGRVLPPDDTEPRGAEAPPVPAPGPTQTLRLTPLEARPPRFRWGPLLLAELRLLLKGQPLWWYLVAAGLVVGTLLLPLGTVRQFLVPASMVWPVFVWSGLGCREARFRTGPLVFSAPRPLWSQIPVAWLAGFTVTLLLGGASLVRFGLAGDVPTPVSLAVGLLFIPSLALALGVWTRTNKPFEVVYVVFWYLGLLNKVLELDYLGLHSPGTWPAYLFLSVALFLLALVGRSRQLGR